MSPRETLLARLDKRAASDPGAPLIIDVGGATYTYRDAVRLVHGWADWFCRERSGRHLRVAALLPNTAVTHLLRLAAAHAGVVFCPLNPMLSGKPLLDALIRSRITDVLLPLEKDGRVADAHAVLLGHRAEFAIHWCVGDQIDFENVPVDPDAVPPAPPVTPCHTLVYTSGTSGPAKPVRLPAELMVDYGRQLFGDDDKRHWSTGGYYSPWQPAHVLGAIALEAAVERGLTLVLRKKFDLETFWTDIVTYDCRLTVMISVADSLWASRACAPDENPLEVVGVSPALRDSSGFEERFGVKVLNIYGMTELGTVMTSSPREDHALTGRPSRHFQCRIAPFEDGPIDLYGPPVADERGVGELVVRPVGVTSSYETGVDPTRSWRDGWFHTGDLFIESAGEFRFVGRMKDSIRRNGRTISAQDLEDEVRALAGVDQCACVGYCEAGSVEDASRDDEIRLFVVAETAEGLDVESLVAALRERLPVYMLPRYVDVLSALPLTDNGKLSRHTLRHMPLTPETFDRKADRRVDALSGSGSVLS